VTYDENVSPRERKIARILAIGMHVVVLLLLIFGVVWQRRVSQPAAVVDLWSSTTPPKAEPKSKPKPKPKPEPEPEPKPKPKPKVEHKPPPPPPKPETKPIPKADIALKERLEKERKLKEQQELEKKREREVERRKEDEAKKRKAEREQRELEAKKKEEEKKKLEKERVAKEAEAKKAAAEKAALDAKLAREAAAAQSRIYDEYIRQIVNKVRRNIVEPPNLQGNPQVEFDVRLLPGGDVLDSALRMTKSSGNAAYDEAVQRAILRASPLPLPPDPSMFNMFRELHLRIRPKE
jgi:colicin import membrane protein